jgi:hydrogenase/urease accessory protein HupE
MNTGLGPFYDGLAHLFVTPELLLPIVALTLWAGLRGPRCGRAVLLALPAAWLAGAVLGALAAYPVTLAAAAAMTLALGALAAADAKLPTAAVAGVAVALGLVQGSANWLELSELGSAPLGTAGSVTALVVVACLLVGQVAALRTPIARLAVRVAGSWIAASGLLMLGWALRR